MKILLLTKKFPYPLREGEPIAISYLSRSLRARGCELDLLVLNTSKHYFEPDQLPSSHNFFRNIYSVKVDNHITLPGAVKSLIRGESYILSRFDSPAFAAKLKEVLSGNSYDVVQLETLYMAHYIPVIRQNSASLVVMRAHNVEHEIWERVALTTTNLFKKWYLRYQNKSLRKFEISKLQEYDMLLAITERDLKVFKNLGFHHDAVVTPVGIALNEYVPDFQCFQNNQLTVGFIGALDWMPNQNGIVWFLEKVWPKISERYPELEFHIAGKNTPEWLLKKAGNRVIVHGEVEDAKKFLNSHPVLVAPLFSGSGIKIKVLEGMALSRAVITTPVGAEGIPARSREHLLIARTAEEFIRQLEYCMEQPLMLREMGRKARQFIQVHFDSSTIAGKVYRAYEKRLAKR